MKKILLSIFCVFAIVLLSGCEMDNTPTRKVERFLDNYRNLDETVINQMNDIVASDTMMNDAQKEEYRNVLKRQYQDLTYTIKDETVDGDTAVVTVEIDVYDYYKATLDSDAYYTANPDQFKDDAGNLDQSKYLDYKIEKMKNTMERVKYTIDFTLKKENGNWIMDEITDATRQKIHGLYAYQTFVFFVLIF